MHHHSASWMQRLRNEDLSPTAAGPEWYNEWKWVGVEGEHGGREEDEGAGEGEEAGTFLAQELNLHASRCFTLHVYIFICLFCG